MATEATDHLNEMQLPSRIFGMPGYRHSGICGEHAKPRFVTVQM